jgi:muramidase (phage lysozyme)
MSIFKESFPDYIQKQIGTRQKLISGDIRNTAVKHLNSRSSWVRMSSSVNVNGLPDLAKNNVLFNGVSSNTGAGQYQMNKGFGNSNGTYKKGPLGFRPMPGIDNISVKNKGAYGSLREVVVNFKCWDINQLEDLEVLYMRPGYTLLIEWGWSNYLVEDKNGVGQLKQMDEYYDILNITTPKTIFEITKELRAKIENSQGNYDAMYGKVKNYSWSARTDGGYDCTTTVISIGEVIESLKVNNTNMAFNSVAASVSGEVLGKPELLGNYDKQKIINSYDKNYLAGIITEFYAYASTIQPGGLTEGVSLSLVVSQYPGTPTLEFFAIDSPGGIPPPPQDSTDPLLTNNIQAYITLESLCHVLNYSILNTANTPLIVTTSSKDNNGDLKPTTCLWNPLQVSVEPSTCIISAPVWENGVNVTFTTSGSSQTLQDIIDAETAAGIGFDPTRFPSEIVKAKEVVVFALKEAMSESTDEDSVIEKIKNFIKYHEGDTTKAIRNLDGAETAYEELQRQYELVRGVGKTIIEQAAASGYSILARTSTTSNPIYNFSRDITQADLTIPFWDFAGVTGIRGNGVSSKGLFDITTGNINGYTYYNIENRDVDLSDWSIEPFKSNNSSQKTFMQALEIFDGEIVANDVIKGAFDEVATLNKTKNPRVDASINEDITKQDNIAQAAATSASAQQTITQNKSVIQYLSKLNKKFVDKNIADEKGVIGNIYINLNYLYKKITADLGNSDRQERNEINLYDFLKGTLKDCQAAIGNLNNFEIYVDDERASIIDVNFTGQLSTAQSSFQVEVQNKKSVVRNYTLQSQIFPEQSSMISIAAQANQDLLNTDSASLKAYSSGITDRALSIPDNSQKQFDKYIKDATAAYESISKSLSKIAEFFANTAVQGTVSEASSTSSNGEYKNALRDLIQFTRNYFKVPGNGFNVIIPTKLSLTFDGLGGVIIGNLFRISENALPKGYKGNGFGSQLGYIVTDISQDVKSGDWTTTIGAQTIILDSPGDGFAWDYNKLVIDLNPSTATNEGANRAAFVTRSTAVNSFGQVSTNVALGQRPLLDTIAYAEGTAGVGNNGYDILVTFVVLENWTPNYTLGHPDRSMFVSQAIGYSDAAGRYQYLYSTWLDRNNKTNVPFTKENQDKTAAATLTVKGITDQVSLAAYNIAKQQIADNKINVSANPSFMKFLDATYKVWASLPSSRGAQGYPDQGGKYTAQEIYDVYIEAVKKY